MSNKEQIWLQHRRPGHPSFNVLKIIFPSLFKNVSIESLHCDICAFAKHKRSSYPISKTRSLVPFELIHSDIWVHLTFLMSLGFDGLCHLLMTALG